MYEEVVNRYSEIIDSHCEQCEFFIKVLSDYNNFRTVKKQGEKINEFIGRNTFQNLLLME